MQNIPPNTYDCIISCGGTADLIRRVTDLPVVDIQISVYDVLRAIKLAENYTDLYAIVGFPSVTESAHTLCSLLNYDLDILTVNSAEDVKHTLERLRQGGYRMVVCDMVTHTIARQMGFDAFLITSGVESLHAAIDQAVSISSWFERLRQENLFAEHCTKRKRSCDRDGNRRKLVLQQFRRPSAELLNILRSHLREVPLSGTVKLYYTERDHLYSITAQQLQMNSVRRYLFYCVPSRIPLTQAAPGSGC